MIRRVLLSVINSSHPQRGLLQAFTGIFGPENVREYDFMEEVRRGKTIEAINQIFAKVAIDWRPDWIYLQVQDSEILRSESVLAIRSALPKCVVTHWTGDLRPAVSPYLSSFCKATHLTLISSVGQIPMFKEAGAKEVRYYQIAVDWDEDIQGIPVWSPPFRVPEVVLCGHYYGATFPGTRDRELAIAALMEAKVDVGVVGNGWPKSYPTVGSCHVKQQHHVWRRAKVGLNVNHFGNISRYYSDRQLIVMASGTALVCQYVPGLEEEFQNGIHCCWYKTTGELVDIVKKLLADEDMRKRVGSSGRAEVTKNHTWFERIFNVLPDVERIQSRL